LSDAVDPLVPVVLRELVADEPVVPMFDERVPVAALPREVVPEALSPD
jgi:hypothetical protein